MRRALLFAAAAAVACSSPAFAQSRTFDQTLKLSPGGSLSLTATKGSVRLTAWDRDEVQIHARIEAGSDDEYGKEAVDATQVDVSGDGRSVRIRSNYDTVPRHWTVWGNDSRTTPDIHYEIRAPKRVDVDLDIDRSNSEISGFAGRVTIDADRSELRVRDIEGDLRVEIDRGGHSRFANLRGSFILEGDRTDLELAVAKLTDRSRLEIDRGDAEIRVPADQALTLRSDVERRGRFDVDLPLQGEGGSDRSPEGTINGGGPTLTVVARRARVDLRKL